MKTIEFYPLGKSFADAFAEEKARKFLLSDETFISVSTDNFITAVRVLIAEKIISHKRVKFVFNGKTLRPNVYAQLEHWPLGFCDHNMKWMGRLIRAGLDSRKKG